MSAAAVLFPPEIFVDQLLVSIRDATLRLPGSQVSFHHHARQAAALAAHRGAQKPTVAAALLYGYGEIVARSWARHPARSTPIDPTTAGVAHLGTHLPESVVRPIALMSQANTYAASTRHVGMVQTPAQLRFETEPYAGAALELAEIDRLAGNGPMLTPPLDEYRDLLHGLCRRVAVVEPVDTLAKI